MDWVGLGWVGRGGLLFLVFLAACYYFLNFLNIKK